MKVLDLFSGIGGFSLGLERAGMTTAAFCEIEKYPKRILRKHWPDTPIYDDVRELTAERLINDGITAELICGGYPCQPFSVAGKQRGQDDDRHLWPEMYRLIESIRPRWVIAENVAGHISMGLDDVLSDLEAANYSWWTFVIPACAVNAIHRRDRVWILAHSNSIRIDTRSLQRFGEAGSILSEREVAQSISASSDTCAVEILADSPSARLERRGQAEQQESCSKNQAGSGVRLKRHGDIGLASDTEHNGSHGLQEQGSNGATVPNDPNRSNKAEQPERVCKPEDVADTERKGLKGRELRETPSKREGSSRSTSESGNDTVQEGFRPIELPTESPVCPADDGLPDRVARLKALGNAVVPQIPELIGRFIMEIEAQTK